MGPLPDANWYLLEQIRLVFEEENASTIRFATGIRLTVEQHFKGLEGRFLTT
jgi:hypothetical protein